MEKFRILLVDDVPDNIYSLKMMIEDSFDVEIYSALNAQEGIEILMKEDVDLINGYIAIKETKFGKSRTLADAKLNMYQ